MASDRHAAFIPWATTYMGFSPNTQEERHLKMATMAFDDVYLPVGADHLSNIRAQMADDLVIQLKLVEGAWHSIESIHPNLAGKQLATECFTPTTIDDTTIRVGRGRKSSEAQSTPNWRRIWVFLAMKSVCELRELRQLREEDGKLESAWSRT